MARFRRLGIAIVALACAGSCVSPSHVALRPPHAPEIIAPLASAETEPDAAPPDASSPDASAPDEDPFSSVDAAVNDALAQSKMPGCVLIVGRRDEILLRRAYGARALLPARTPMTTDTVFDLASLTKPLATATSVMILVDRGKLDLDARASVYVPELAKLPPFSVRNLLTHSSGLPAVTAISDYALDRHALMERLGTLKLRSQPGERFLYSDTGFIVLEEIVRRVSGRSLDAFAAEEIYRPLGMSETGFRPDADLRARAAPTEMRNGAWMMGDVHDPRAHAAGGVAGNAGLFSTADDLARFAQVMLDGTRYDGEAREGRLVSEKTLTKFFTPDANGRALGWDMTSGFATHKSPLFSARAFGHGGYTGTAMWIDPDRDLFLVFLSNRVHPDGKGSVNPLVAELGTRAIHATEVDTGIDVLMSEGFARLNGAHVALLTNANARAKNGTSTIDAFRAAAPGVMLSAIFTPEHGLHADREGKIADASYGGLPVYSLYGDHFSPTPDSLAGVDTLVVDLQDVGVRFYTYASTMRRAMAVATERHMHFVVIDRPNPIDGVDVEGPVISRTPSIDSFSSPAALPVRHGMTMGELAGLFAADDGLDVDLSVVRMKNWDRRTYFDRTGLAWVSPSPNLRTVDEAVLYPAIGLLEGTNVSVGRGTDTPFEVLGAPWIDGAALAKKLSAVPGVTFEETTFTPRSSRYASTECHGVRIHVTDRRRFDPLRTSLEIAVALNALSPDDWTLDKLAGMLADASAISAIRSGASAIDVEASWSKDLSAFEAKRARFLLYR